MGLPRFHETTFQIIISGQNRALELLLHTNYYMDGMNQMWILKNSTDPLEYIQSRSISSCNIIKTIEQFPTLN
jgi:hypothetical protein